MNTEIEIFGIKFKNPVWVSSGTFGYGREFADFFDINTIGAIVTKTVTAQSRAGNPPPRLIETPSGLLNSIGLENPGVDQFVNEAYPFLKKLNTKIIISVAGTAAEEFIFCIDKLSEDNFPDAFEVNLSCPNVKCSKNRLGLIAQSPKTTEQIISEIKKITDKKLVAKLSPNVTNIAEIAMAAQGAGADAVAMVNSFAGIAIDSHKMKPVLGNIIGGVGGPAIKPMALKAVYDCYKKIDIPIIGIGGITKACDVAEFMLCGASAVQIGTGNFINPKIHPEILSNFKNYLKNRRMSASDLTGFLHRESG